MLDVDSIYKKTLEKIASENDEEEKKEARQRQHDEHLQQRIQEVMDRLLKIALVVFATEGEFFKFMLGKMVDDPYSRGKSRMIIANFQALDTEYEPGNKKYFRIHIVLERKDTEKLLLPTPQKLSGYREIRVSCGYWERMRGMLRVEHKIPASIDLLRFIERINSPEIFVDSCVRANMH